MQKIFFASALIFIGLISNAQSLEGKWTFEKMSFFGSIIYYDDSKKDIENLMNSWIKMNNAENDLELKNEINKNKELIYETAKKIFKSSIEFKDLELNHLMEWTTGKLTYNSQGADEKIKNKDVDIQLKYMENVDYSIMTFPMFGDFHTNEKLKVFSKSGKLVLEAIPGRDITEDFIIHYRKGN